MASDRVAAAVAELYGADPDAFTGRRKALVLAAREAGDKQSAAAIGALRKPTRAAWVVNRLARDEPDAAGRMADLAAELRAAEAAKDGPRLRELSAVRGSLLDGLVAQALAAAGTPDPPPSLRAEVMETLTAAMADADTAAGFASGTLTKAAQWSGFGYADPPPADESSPADLAAPRPAPTSHPVRAPQPARLPKQASRLKRDRPDASASANAQTAATSAQTAAQRAAQKRELEQQRQAAEEQRLAEETAERAAQARKKFEDAERTLALASAAAAEAATVEDRLEAEVRDLEGRVTQAREDLAAARRHARQAEATERRARQILDRLAHP